MPLIVKKKDVYVLTLLIYVDKLCRTKVDPLLGLDLGLQLGLQLALKAA